MEPGVPPHRHPHDFASDNHAGVHPDVLEAVVAANVGHTPAYGDDPWTAAAVAAVRAHLGADVTSSPSSTGPARTSSPSPH
jgi:threonine aldolase